MYVKLNNFQQIGIKISFFSFLRYIFNIIYTEIFCRRESDTRVDVRKIFSCFFF